MLFKIFTIEFNVYTLKFSKSSVALFYFIEKKVTIINIISDIAIIKIKIKSQIKTVSTKGNLRNLNIIKS